MSIQINKNYFEMPIGTVDNQYAMGSSNSSPIIVAKAPDGSTAGLACKKDATGKLYRGVLLRKVIDGAKLDARLVNLESEVLPEAGHSLGLVKAWHGDAGAFVQSYVSADANGEIHSQVYYYHPPVVALPEGKMLTENFDWGFIGDAFMVLNVKDPRRQDPAFKPLKVDGQWAYYEIRIDTDVVTWALGDHVGVFDIPLVAEPEDYIQADVWHGNSWTKWCNIELLDESEVPRRTPEELAEKARLIKAGQDRRAELERIRVEQMRAKKLADRKAAADAARAASAAARAAERAARIAAKKKS